MQNPLAAFAAQRSAGGVNAPWTNPGHHRAAAVLPPALASRRCMMGRKPRWRHQAAQARCRRCRHSRGSCQVGTRVKSHGRRTDRLLSVWVHVTRSRLPERLKAAGFLLSIPCKPPLHVAEKPLRCPAVERIRSLSSSCRRHRAAAGNVIWAVGRCAFRIE